MVGRAYPGGRGRQSVSLHCSEVSMLLGLGNKTAYTKFAISPMRCTASFNTRFRVRDTGILRNPLATGDVRILRIPDGRLIAATDFSKITDIRIYELGHTIQRPDVNATRPKLRTLPQFAAHLVDLLAFTRTDLR